MGEEMNNWKELVGLQHLTMRDGRVNYLTFDTVDGQFSFVVRSAKVECVLTEDETIERLNQIFNSFTTKSEPSEIKIHRAKIEVARKSRRGVANTQWGNAMYYRGVQKKEIHASQMDAPVIVGEFEGKYGILIHPKFDDYGFIVTNNQ